MLYGRTVTLLLFGAIATHHKDESNQTELEAKIAELSNPILNILLGRHRFVTYQ